MRPLVREPIYHQLNDRLRRLIRSGEFPAGQQFLTERQVAGRFNISRVTANKALSGLVSEGLLEFRKGVGTFVRDPGMDYDLRSLMSFTRKAELSGKLPETSVLAFVTGKAADCAAVVREALHVGAGEAVHYVERLRMADAVPLILERRYIVARHCPRLTEKRLAGSLYTAFTESYGLVLTGADQTVRATNLTRKDAKRLRVPDGSAALWVRAVGQCQHGPLWLEDTLYRGDFYEFHNAIGSDRAPRPARAAMVQGPSIRLLSAPRK